MAAELSDTGTNRVLVTRVGLPLAIVVIAGLYLLTMPRLITLEDAGIFQMVCHLGGISHPPGYPLFTSFCQQVMFGTTPLAGNLVSFYFALAAVLVLYFVVLEMCNDALVALLAASAYGLTKCLWSQAIIIEVYSLAAFQFLLSWWLLLRFTHSGQTKYWYALCVCAGLALSNHWPLFVLSCLGFVSVLWSERERFIALIRVPSLFWSIGLFLVGLSPYLLLFQSDPAIAMYGEVGRDNFTAYVMRDYYDDNHLGSRAVDKWQYLGWMLPLTAEQLGIVAVPVALLGLFVTGRSLGLVNFISLLLIYIGSTFVLAALLSFRYEPQVKGVFLPYPVIAMAAYSIWFALGAGWLYQRLKAIRPVYGGVVLIILMLSIPVSNYFANDRSRSRLADDFGRLVLNSMPINAVLLVGGDNQIGPIGFLSRVEGLRPDVTVQSVGGLLFSDNLVPRKLPPLERLELLRQFKKDTGRRVFTIDQLSRMDVDYGVFYEFEGDGEKRVFLPEVEQFADYLTQMYQAALIVDAHESVMLHGLIVGVARLYAEEAVIKGVEQMPLERQRRLQALQATLPGKMSSLRTMTAVNPLAEGLLEFGFAVEADLDRSIAKQHDALVYEFIGRILLAKGDKGGAEAYFQRALAAFPAEQNAALCQFVALSTPERQELVLAELQLRASNCLKEPR